MKQITNKTVLRQGDKVFQPVEVDGVIYWVDEEVVCKTGEPYLSSFLRRIIPKSKGVMQAGDKIVSQSQTKLEGIPVISLDSYVERLAEKHFLQIYSWDYKTTIPYQDNQVKDIKQDFIKGYNSNPNYYTQKDIEKAIELARYGVKEEKALNGLNYRFSLSTEEIFEQISPITEIEVDDTFQILKYE